MKATRFLRTASRLSLLLALSAPAWAAVDLNSATQSELESLKGIGPNKARAIIDYRAKHGRFKRIEELDLVQGFGPASVARLKRELVVRPDTPTR